MSYGSYNILEKSYKYNTIAYTSNYKFITLNDYIYLKEYPRISYIKVRSIRKYM